MSQLTQVREIVLMNLRSVPQRLGASLVIVIGIAGVVGVMVALLSMSSGLEKTLSGTGGYFKTYLGLGYNFPGDRWYADASSDSGCHSARGRRLARR